MIMPILGIMKVMLPNRVVKKLTFRPLAITLWVMLSTLSTASKASIIPIIEPKRPMTNPKILTSDAKVVIFLAFS